MCGVRSRRRVASVCNVRDFGSGVALLGWADEDAVATHRNTRRASEWAGVAGFQLAGGRAPRVAAVLVVTLLAYLDDAVAAGRLLTYAGLARCARTGGVHGQAIRRATRAPLELTLVALLTRSRLHDPVAAGRQLLAGPWGTAPSSLRLAIRAAAVAHRRGIAGLAGLDASIATGIKSRAFLAGYALVAGVLCLAVCGATWIALVGALITGFTGVDHTVAAGETDNARLTWGRTSVVGFDLADPVAPIASQGVAVVAGFAGLVDLAVTASRRCCTSTRGGQWGCTLAILARRASGGGDRSS